MMNIVKLIDIVRVTHSGQRALVFKFHSNSESLSPMTANSVTELYVGDAKLGEIQLGF